MKPIKNPLSNEHLLELFPKPSAGQYSEADVEELWRLQRTHFFEGRSLNDQPLTDEQQFRSRYLTLQGQRLSAGVVEGLEASLEPDEFIWVKNDFPKGSVRLSEGGTGVWTTVGGKTAFQLAPLAEMNQDGFVEAPGAMEPIRLKVLPHEHVMAQVFLDAANPPYEIRMALRQYQPEASQESWHQFYWRSPSQVWQSPATGGFYKFRQAQSPLIAAQTDQLWIHVLLSPEHPPTSLKVTWFTAGDLVSTAIWVASPPDENTPPLGLRTKLAGLLPEPGRWSRLSIAVAYLEMPTLPIDGMSIEVMDGQLSWADVGTTSANGTEQFWIQTHLPNGAEVLVDADWQTSTVALEPPQPQPTTIPFSSRRALLMENGGFFSFLQAPMLVSLEPSDRLIAYVYLDPQRLPSQFEMWWIATDSNRRLRRVYWHLLDKTVQRRPWGVAFSQDRGPLPPAGEWVRLDIAASDLGLDGATLEGLMLLSHDGRMAVAHIGKVTASGAVETVWMGDELPAAARLSEANTAQWIDLQATHASFPPNVPQAVVTNHWQGAVAQLGSSGRWLDLFIAAALTDSENLLFDGLRLTVVGGRAAWANLGKIAYHCQILAGTGLTRTGHEVGLVTERSLPIVNLLCHGSDYGLTATLPDHLLHHLIHSEAATDLPRAGILLLQPVETTLLDAPKSQEVCGVDLDREAFLDRRTVEGCRLVFYLWPQALKPLPALESTEAAAIHRWRNRLAHIIFNYELQLPAEQPLPWETLGVPIALLGFDSSWRPLFCDRYAVVRQGGEIKPLSLPIAPVGNPFLWQARILQFVEQLADLTPLQLPANVLADHFGQLPPVGYLPPQMFDIANRRLPFFPGQYDIQAAPVPLEQLDLVFHESAPLLPFDISRDAAADQVQVLVPVPQKWYEPELLQVAEVDPEFGETLLEFTRRRNEWLYRRQLLRDQIAVLARAIAGAVPLYPEDPDALDNEDFALPSFSSSRVVQLHPQQSFVAFRNASSLTAKSVLTAYVFIDPAAPPQQIRLSWIVTARRVRTAYWGENTSVARNLYLTNRFMGPLPASGKWIRLTVSSYDLGVVEPISGFGIQVIGGKAAFGHIGTADVNASPDQDIVWIGNNLPLGAEVGAGGWPWVSVFGKTSAPITEADYGTTVKPQGRVAIAFEQLQESLKTSFLSSQEQAELSNRGVRNFIQFLQHKVDTTDEHIFWSYSRLGADIYRINEFLLGREASTRMVSNTVLGKSILKAQEDLVAKTTVKEFVTKDVVGVKPDPTQLKNIAEQQKRYLKDQGLASQDLINEFEDSITYQTQIFEVSIPEGNRVRVGARDVDRGTIFLARGTRIRTPDRQVLILGETVINEIPPRSEITPAEGSQIITASNETLPLHASNPLSFNRSVAVQVKFKALDTPPVGVSIRSTEAAVMPMSVASSFTTQAASGEAAKLSVRLNAPRAVEAKNFAVIAKYELVKGFKQLAATESLINLTGVAIPGVVEPSGDDDANPLLNFEEISNTTVNNILKGQYDKITSGLEADEALYLTVGVRTLEGSVGILKAFEQRLNDYRRIIDQCQAVLAELEKHETSAKQRLEAIGQELSEARHDITVAKELLSEEEKRIADINKRRRTILATQVDILVFHRPRMVNLHLSTPSRVLYPSFTQAGKPTCFSRAPVPPPALQAGIDLLRDAPVNWFVYVPALLHLLNRTDLLLRSFDYIQRKAIALAPLQSPPLLLAQTQFTQSIQQIVGAGDQILAQYRLQRSQLNLGAIAPSWQQLRDRAESVFSLGDLIDGNHQQNRLSQAAAEELQNISRALSCLYDGFSKVQPIIRLSWAEQLSQYDHPVDLKDLSVLPRWPEIDPIQRQELQVVLDWLYQRINPKQPQALQLLNDLVRVCVLLASASPVDEIITGRTVEPTPIIPLQQIKVKIDPAKVHIGMQVTLYTNSQQVVAKGIVKDLTANFAAAEVQQVFQSNVQLPTNAPVHFSPPEPSPVFPLSTTLMETFTVF
ncbi:hypothetical protein ACQ4M4_21850 [Leptolyngbya sp. AN02str]|uniref:hypothetical protein n=1 Tax=Leptolyngbya sp. AN02str TaxID=3423363 RepID=UPI003D315BDF